MRRQGWWPQVGALGAGLLLRAAFVAVHPRFVGDTLVYGDLAQNLLQHHAYGLTEEGHVRATLIRLPGYPLLLAMSFLVFGLGSYLPVLFLQVGVDLLGCLLLGRLAVRMFGERVGLVCLWLAALCPFTANYAAAALTETLSIFCVVLGLWGLAAWIGAVRAGRREWAWAGVVGVAMSAAVLLRPDGILLTAALLPAMAWVARKGAGVAAVGDLQVGSGQDTGTHKRLHAGEDGPAGAGNRWAAWRGVLVAAAMVAGCLGIWAGRNWRVFHLVQVLAPKYANDPGEPAPLGFARWYRTWGVSLGDTARVYWMYDGGELRLQDLPSRAFDSAAQRQKTAQVYAQYNAETSATPASEAGFAQLAAERVRAHPLRYYVLLPLARLGEMWLRPRTELLRRMPLDWWRVEPRYGPGPVVFAWCYGLLNAALLGCAGVGLWRWWRGGWGGWGAMAAAMMSLVALRSGLLLTIDNAEPRYVLECYPVVLALAARGVGGFPAVSVEACTSGCGAGWMPDGWAAGPRSRQDRYGDRRGIA